MIRTANITTTACTDRVYQRAGQVIKLLKVHRQSLARHMLAELVGLGAHSCQLCSANVGGRASVALDKLKSGNLAGCRYELKWLQELTRPNLPHCQRRKL